MMTAEQAMEKAVKYEAQGNKKMADFYLRCAVRREESKKLYSEIDDLRASFSAIKSAQRSVTGSIHR